MSQAAAESFAAMIEAGMSGIAYLGGILQYPAIWYRIYKYGADGISVPSQLLLALSYLTLYFLPLLGPHPSFLPYIPSLAFAFFFIPFPLYTLYLLHTRSRAIFPSTLPPSEKSQCYTIGAVCLALALVFNYEWFLWGGKWGGGEGGGGGGRRGTGAWGLGWLYEILWAFGTYLGAVGIWPQLRECEKEGRAELVKDRWLMGYLGLLYLSAGMQMLRSCLGAVNIHWDPLAFYASLFATVLFTYYIIKIFVLRSTSPAFSLPSFTSSSPSSSSWSVRNWSWPWRRSEYVALSGEEEPLYDDRRDYEEQDRIRASSAAAAADARLAAERAVFRGALFGK